VDASTKGGRHSGSRNKVISVWDACERYDLSAQELAEWERDLDRYGVPGLRTTRVSIYRKTSKPK
jgi:hypothetical protein